MNTSLVMTVIGSDRPGLVESISEVVGRHGGNWLESRMSHMAGHFAGILRVEISSELSEALIKDLRGRRWVVLRFYWVGGRATGNAAMAKILQIWAALTGGPPGAAAILLSTEYEEAPEDAVRRLQAFLDAAPDLT